MLTQEDVNLALSHVNSAPRPSLERKSPYNGKRPKILRYCAMGSQKTGCSQSRPSKK